MSARPTTSPVIVITGASRGLGAGLATELRARGARLGLCARSPIPQAADDGVSAAQFDITDHQATERFAAQVAERFGRIDAWINNAGVLEPIAPVRDIDPGAFEQALRVNVMGVLSGTQAFVRHLRAQRHSGVLINISSGAARHGYAGWGAYCASKAGVDLLTWSTQEEERPHLRAHSVAPGIIDTDMQALIRKQSAEVFPDVAYFQDLKAQGRFSSIPFVARHMWELLFPSGEPPKDVLQTFPLEH